ncbi:MAG: type I-C CRISPR-associated protein Cas8c/Csd1 [Oscillospiraceae bacterium]|nr:type I-C CRISPR-associated protein Cas8c/Csd1 [Oscillospiraceae bacterium]
MSWTEELYKVYDQQCGVEHNDGKVLLPISHSTANAQIEVTLREDGSFVTARALTKEEGQNTIIPVTEDSGGRTSGICAMPFADKLIYLAGDYMHYADKDNSENFNVYIKQLNGWHESPYTHPSVDAVYSYISQRTLMRDLIDCHVLETDLNSGKLADGVKIAAISQEDAFVRFRIQSDNPETWKDKTLYDSFIAWYDSIMEEKQLCYATGNVIPATYKHPSKIRDTGDKAKLISSNDESGFTYRGRFADKNEAISVSYDFSQKMHNALKWMISRQGLRFDSMRLVVWASGSKQAPDILEAPIKFDEDDDEFFDEADVPDTEPIYRQRLKDCIYGSREKDKMLKIDPDSKVMIMAVDAATTGRLSIALYEELEHSRLLEQLVKWHSETAALRYFSKQRTSRFCSFSVRDIINCAYGLDNGKGYLDCKDEVRKDNVLRLIPCITRGLPLPADIMRNLFYKASNPQSYDRKFNNHRKVVETACGMIRKFNIDRKKGVITMAYDPNERDRSYLYGCLLAIADAAEYASFDEADRKNRETNARRYWNMFSKRPYSTWKTIREQLGVYMNKLGSSRIRYEKMFDEVMAKFDLKEFSDNKPLEPAYLLGYQHYHSEIFKKKEEE